MAPNTSIWTRSLGIYSGLWIHNEGTHIFRMTLDFSRLQPCHDDMFKLFIEWEIIVAPSSSHYAAIIGTNRAKAEEVLRCHSETGRHVLKAEGIECIQVDNVIALDEYKLYLSTDCRILEGITRGHSGLWKHQFHLVRVDNRNEIQGDTLQNIQQLLLNRIRDDAISQ